MSWLIDILSLCHSIIPLMIVTLAWILATSGPHSPSLQWHFYGSSIIHFLIHSYTLHSHQMPGTQRGAGETKMSKTLPLPLRSPGQVGEKYCCHKSTYSLCQATTLSGLPCQKCTNRSKWGVVSSPLVNLRAGSKPSLLFHHPHIKTPPRRLSWWASLLSLIR